VSLKITEKHSLSDSVGSVEYTISEVEQQISITRDAGMFASQPRLDRMTSTFSQPSGRINTYNVTFVFIDPQQVGRDVYKQVYPRLNVKL
jgi:hypothetical protein